METHPQVGRLLATMITDTGNPLTTPRDIEVQRNALAAACSHYGLPISRA